MFVYHVYSLQPCGHLFEMADLLALLYVIFSCVFVTFPCGVLGQVWCLIESNPDLSLLFYFIDNCEIVTKSSRETMSIQ